MNQFPPRPRVFHLDRFEFFRKLAEIFASQGAPPVSTTPVANLPPVSGTPVANFSTIFASVFDTVANLPPVSTIPAANNATGVNDAGGKLPPVLTWEKGLNFELILSMRGTKSRSGVHEFKSLMRWEPGKLTKVERSSG